LIRICVLIGLLVLGGTACGTRSFDARELAAVVVTGANGYGTLTVKSNAERIAQLIKEEGDSLRETDEEGIRRLFIREAALNSLIFTADRVTGLKNGDEITIRASHDEELAKAGHVRFRNNKFVYRVDHLEEAEKIDIESEVKLVFSGFESRGTAEIELSGNTERYREHFSFTFLTPKTNLSNGERVELRVMPDNSGLTSKGCIAEEVVLPFTVEGLQPLRNVDFFENLALIYDGVSDQGTVSIDTTRLPAEWVEPRANAEPPLLFSVTPAVNLSNGDKVNVVAQADHEWFADHGMASSVVSKDFTVSGLKEYPRNLDHVDLMPLFDKLGGRLEEDIQARLIHNYWNDDSRAGDPLSRWDYLERHGVVRIFYGYPQANRADNFVALIYKVSIEGTCAEAIPYQSHYSEGDRVFSTLYLIYVVDSIMYDTERVDDFKEVNLKIHDDIELSAVSQFKEQYGGAGVIIVEASVPEQVRYTDN